MNVPQMPSMWICTYIDPEIRNALNTQHAAKQLVAMEADVELAGGEINVMPKSKGTKVHEGKAKARGTTEPWEVMTGYSDALPPTSLICLSLPFLRAPSC
jgi:hypothetical protein